MERQKQMKSEDMNGGVTDRKKKKKKTQTDKSKRQKPRKALRKKGRENEAKKKLHCTHLRRNAQQALTLCRQTDLFLERHNRGEQCKYQRFSLLTCPGILETILSGTRTGAEISGFPTRSLQN